VHPGFLHRAIRRALLGGCTLRACRLEGCALRACRLGGCSASTCCLNSSNTLPCSLGGCSPDLRNDWGWTVAPAGDEGHMNIRGSTAPDEQRLQAPRGSAWLRHRRRARHRHRVRRPPPRLAPLQGVEVGTVGAIIKLAGGRRPLLHPSRGIDLTGRGSLRLGSTRPAAHRMGADHPLVLSCGVSRLSRAQAHGLVAPGRRRLA
jgi:hypothetical protein